jgi:hypothetical protein
LSEYANLRGMTDAEPKPISIALSPAQVDAVVRAATQTRAPGVSLLIGNVLRAPGGGELAHAGSVAGADGEDTAGENGYDEDSDPRMSRSLMRGLSLLTRFGPDGSERGIVELSRELGMSPSTAHRYASTLVELGLLERSPRTRKYRLPSVL